MKTLNLFAAAVLSLACAGPALAMSHGGAPMAAKPEAMMPAKGCDAMAADKKLAGAAKTSFLKKCEKDHGDMANAGAICDKLAADKKLAGAAKASHIKKCLADHGTPAGQ